MADKAAAWGEGPNRGTAKATPNRQRQCWAIQTLVKEVHGLFPETPVEYSNHNAFNAALAVTFDLTAMEGGDSVVFNNLMDILDTDERVVEVIKADYDQTFVRMSPVATRYDSRESFGLADAYSILTDNDDDEADGEGWFGPDWDPTPGNPFNGVPEVTTVRGGIRFSNTYSDILWGSM